MLSPTARAHRADLAELAGLAESDLSILFQDVSNANHVHQVLMDTLPRLVDVYGLAAASLGADWYDGLREQASVKGKFRAIVADLPNIGRTDALAGWSVSPLYGAEPDAATALSKASGGLQRIIFNADRDTVRISSTQDRAARGWQREGGGDCGFCAMLVARGAVYSEATADFASHDRCKCVAVPAFGGEPNPVKPYTPTNRNITANDRARLREYLAGNRANNATNAPKSAVLNRAPGAQTAERAASIKAQLASYEKTITNGDGTEWMREQVKKLRKEQAAFKG